ncbi:SURF1 family protein [Novosphingobium sp. fls2-241-R2A-195]|uniref:SURF1 family protein n=1 Tax=Novosphingobium sp. fls2-241-R2A-195 TaxID=3040296 RepID=UPI00254C3FA1|nr:SURF1 family protein [Novosphingobium sp. fls2-241-R2A-195]
MRRIPVFATLIVLAAVAVMIAMGFWQLRRLHEKEALLAHYAAAQKNPAPVEWTSRGIGKDLLYRRAHLVCAGVGDRSSIAGSNAKGEPGVAQTAECTLPGGGRALVVMGWSLQPNAGAWQGGDVTGMIAPGPRLVAMPAVGGLKENAIPDPADLPNNHLSYAGQWFFFAVTALVIYFLALRKRK